MTLTESRASPTAPAATESPRVPTLVPLTLTKVTGAQAHVLPSAAGHAHPITLDTESHTPAPMASPTAPAATETPQAFTAQVQPLSVQVTGALSHVLRTNLCPAPEQTPNTEFHSAPPQANHGYYPEQPSTTARHSVSILERLTTDTQFLFLAVTCAGLLCIVLYPYVMSLVRIIDAWSSALLGSSPETSGTYRLPSSASTCSCTQSGTAQPCHCTPTTSTAATPLRTTTTLAAHPRTDGPAPSAHTPMAAHTLPRTPLYTGTLHGTLRPATHQSHSSLTSSHIERMAHLNSSTSGGLVRSGNVFMHSTPHPPVPALTFIHTEIDSQRTIWYQFIKKWTLWRTQSPTNPSSTLYGALLSAGLDQPDAYALHREWAAHSGIPGLLPASTLANEHELLMLIENWAAPRVPPSMALRVRARTFTTLPSSVTNDSRSEWIVAYRTHLLSILRDYDIDSITEKLFKDACGLVQDPQLRTAITTFMMNADSTLENVTGMQPLLTALNTVSLYFRGLSLDLMHNGLTSQLINDLLPAHLTGSPQRRNAQDNHTASQSPHQRTVKDRALRRCDHPDHISNRHTNAECSLQSTPCPAHPDSGHTAGQCDSPAPLALTDDVNHHDAHLLGNSPDLEEHAS